MSRYNATVHPGTHLVAEALGITEGSTLYITYCRGEPLYRSATRVIGSTYEWDAMPGRVTYAVKDALRLLESTGFGELGGAGVVRADAGPSPKARRPFAPVWPDRDLCGPCVSREKTQRLDLGIWPPDRATAGRRGAAAPGHQRRPVPARQAPLAHIAGRGRPA